MSDHTPGPWPLGRARTCDHYTIGDRAPYIAAVRKEADARAISAVPDLVAALGGALMDLEAMTAAADRGEVWHVNAGTRARLEAARAALAKAGEA